MLRGYIPLGIDLEKLHTELAALPNVKEVRDLHVWAIIKGKNSLTVHLVVKTHQDGNILMARALDIVKKYGIDHANFQVEAQGHTLKDLTH